MLLESASLLMQKKLTSKREKQLKYSTRGNIIIIEVLKTIDYMTETV